MTLALVLIVLLVALMIPLTAVILDSQVGRAIAARLEKDREGGGALPGRVAALEGEIDRLNQAVQQLEEESTFIHRLLESKPESEGLLPPGEPPG
jgi:hypothetical protein